MIGVTIGVGEYRALAERAAASMAARTGLRCVVLDEDHLQRAGLADRPAAWLKLWLWDFVDDERVLWFDADTFCLRDWNPTGVANGAAVVAMRDWSWRPGIKAEAESVHVPADEYFLSSVMLLQRSAAMNPCCGWLARFCRTPPDRCTSRRRSTPRASPGPSPSSGSTDDSTGACSARATCRSTPLPIVAHFNSDELRRAQANWALELAGPRLASVPDGEIDVTAFAELGDKYFRYSRIGHDERPILLRSDGTIGHGGGAAERFWFVRRSPTGPRLVIGSETERTCELALDSDGVWRGRWDAYERMPIELMKYRGQVLIDQLGDRQRTWSGVELGIFEGNLSEFLLREMPRLRLWMVDRWHSPLPGERYYEDPYIRQVGQNQMHQALLRTVRITEFAADRRVILLVDQLRAAQCVADGSLDFVFVDSDHSEAGTLEAIDAWWSKLRPGGLMAGHDLDYPGFPGVRRAVEITAAQRGLPWRTESDYVWCFQVPG